MALIDIQNLVKTYESEGVVTTRALRGVDLSIDAGEFVAIMGPSGSGKSTLLHMLGFLDRPTSGTYIFDGQNVDNFSDDELAHIRNEKMGFVFQAFNLLPRTTVLENVVLPLQYSRIPKREWTTRATEAVKKVDLLPRLNHFTGQLSGGERQRVAIARALINNPRVVFADEPTGNLDSVSGYHVMETIEKLHQQGHTIVLVTHETPSAEFAERILEMKDGVIVSDTPVVKRHQHYTK